MKKEDIEFRGLMLLTIVIFGFFFSTIILVRYYPELLYNLGDTLKKIINPPPSLEDLKKVEPMRGKIAFESVREREKSVYIMNTDGTNVTKLIGGGDPAFSPDGKLIAFCEGSNLEGIGIHIYIISVRGGRSIQLTFNRSAVDEFPAWSPDGKKIAFARAPIYNQARIGQYDIYLMNADGSNLTKLTTEGGMDPCWSPDGKKIAFSSNRDGMWGIYIMNADGSNVTKLNIPTEAIDPDWSPDGKKIVFSDFFRIGIFNLEDGKIFWLTEPIWKKNPDGTESPTKDRYPKFSPNGKYIAFQSTREGNWDIYIINADGSNLTRLTSDPAYDQYPAWSPP